MRSPLFPLVVGGLAACGAIFLYAFRSFGPTEKTPPLPVVVTATPDAFSIGTQRPGTRIVVNEARLPAPGFVTIYENEDGRLGNVIGRVYFPPSEEPLSGEDVLLVPLVRNRTYFAALHADNGDGSFQPDIDPFILTANGNRIIKEFSAR